MAGSSGSIIIPSSGGGVSADYVSPLLLGEDKFFPSFHFGNFHSNIVDTINALDDVTEAKVIPIFLGPREVTINGIAYEVTTSRSGETVLACLYDNDDEGTREPGVLLANGGVVSVGTSGIKLHSFTGVACKGWIHVFLAATVNNVGFRALDDSDVNKPNSAPLGGAQGIVNDDAFYYYRNYDFTIGSAGSEADPPSTLAGETVNSLGAAEIPLVYLSIEA